MKRAKFEPEPDEKMSSALSADRERCELPWQHQAEMLTTDVCVVWLRWC